jgi:hypothetical protein
VSISYVGDLDEAPAVQCGEQHVIVGTMESRAYFPQLYGRREYEVRHACGTYCSLTASANVP